MRKTVFACAALASALCSAGVAPVVSNVHMEQLRMTHEVRITYTLAPASAVVTLDIQTNVTGDAWASIGPQNFTNVTGDVFTRVDKASGTIRWRPFESAWLGHVVSNGQARAVVTAYAVDAPPDYMVVDLAETSNARVRYYPSVDYLPGGLLANDAYRTTHLVMRRVPAAGVPFTMGNSTINVAPHAVTLTNDYYIGVFEFTQGQYKAIFGWYPYNNYYEEADRDLHPCDRISFMRIREGNRNATENLSNYTDFFWPNAPFSWSLLGRLRARVDNRIPFDLPTEAQWEFAAKAGEVGNETWNDGSYFSTENIPGQSKERGTDVTTAAGSFAPNALGLYDMHGNVWEFCLDWYGADITALNGAVNIDAAQPTKLADGETDGTQRIRRGGSCHYPATSCRSAIRSSNSNGALYNERHGLRVACPALAVQ